MTGRRYLEGNEALIRVMEQEFHIKKRVWEDLDLKRARQALFVFPDAETFLLETGWAQDNPECASEEYLTQKRIGRWVDGRFLYLSRLLWEEGDE